MFKATAPNHIFLFSERLLQKKFFQVIVVRLVYMLYQFQKKNQEKYFQIFFLIFLSCPAFEPLLNLLESEYPAIQELALSTLITCAQDGKINLSFIFKNLKSKRKVSNNYIFFKICSSTCKIDYYLVQCKTLSLEALSTLLKCSR